SQHEPEVHRHWASRKVSSKSGSQNGLIVTLNEIKWCDGMAIFLFRSNHPVLYRVHTFIRLAVVVHDCVRHEAVRHAFERAGIFNLNIKLDGSRELNGHRFHRLAQSPFVFVREYRSVRKSTNTRTFDAKWRACG